MSKTSVQNLSIVKETSCSVLQEDSISDSAKSTAMSYIPTLRIKEWKPIQGQSEMKDGKQYCFFDNDSSKDGINNLGPNSCSTLSNPFQGIPFITNVFSDDKQDVTSSMPSKKCVIEIDPSHVNTDTLNKFWDQLATSECADLFSVINHQNAGTQSDIDILSADISKLEQLQSDNVNHLAILATKIGEMTQIKSDKTNELSTDRSSLAKVTLEKDVLSKKWDTTYNACTTKLNDYSVSLSNCASNLTSFTTSLQHATALLSTSNPIFEKQQVQYSTNLLAFSNIHEQYTYLQKENSVLNANIDSVNLKLQQCSASFVSCKSMLESCINQDDLVKSDTVIAIRYWNVCKAELSTCTNSLHQCEINLPIVQSNMNTAIGHFESCESSLTNCQGSNSEFIIQKTTLSNNIDAWMGSHFNCTPCNVTIDGLKTTIADIMTWCKFPLKTAADLKAKAIDVQQANVAAAQAQLQACESGSDTLPTTIPTPQQPTAGSAIPDKKLRGPPPPPTETPTPTCTIVLSSLECENNGNIKCYDDKNTYVKFDNAITFKLYWRGGYEGTNTGPSEAIIPTTSLSLADRVVAWAKDQQHDRERSFNVNNWQLRTDPWDIFYKNQIINGTYKVYSPTIYTSKGPGTEDVPNPNVEHKPGHRTEVAQIIPNNGAVCVAQLNAPGRTGFIDAVKHVPHGVFTGRNGYPSEHIRSWNNQWEGEDMWNYIQTVTLHTGTVCDSNFADQFSRNDIEHAICDANFQSVQTFNNLPLRMPGNYLNGNK